MVEYVRNEPAVREEIIAPILKALDYRANGENDIRYELSLRYPQESFGRKKPGRDPPLRGKADYVCYAGGKVTWTVEAKPSSAPISLDDVEQAFSYARHPEVRAVYFCLCNGNEFRVYITEGGPEVDAIVTVDPRNFDATVLTLKELVGVPALLGRFAKRVASALPPIGPGLDSFAQVMQGYVAHEGTTPDIPHMRGFTVFVTGGAIQRVDGNLLAYWESRAPHSAVQELIERLGLLRVEAHAQGDALSVDPNSPTVFTSEMAMIFPKGEKLPNIVTGQLLVLQQDMHFTVRFQGMATLYGTALKGPFDLQIGFTLLGNHGEITSRGKFEFALK